MARDEIDYLAFSGHKMYAPFGSGALVARRGLLSLDAPEWATIRSSGEENVAGILPNSPFDSLESPPGQDEDTRKERDLQTHGPPSDARSLRAVAPRATHPSFGACLP